MALGVPRLDQLITQLDSISGKFDSDDDLNKLEFTKPNLEQLHLWGDIEQGLTLTDTFNANVTIGNSNFTRGQPVVFACEVVFPETVDTACTLFEMGGSGHGVTIGFHDTDTFRLAFGRGNNDTPTNDKTIIDVSKTALPLDGDLHTLVWEMNPTNGTGSIYVDNQLVATGTNSSWSNSIWAGTDAGGFISQLDQTTPAYQFIRANEPNVRWAYGFAGNLRHYQNQSVNTNKLGLDALDSLGNLDSFDTFLFGKVQ